MNQFEAQIEKMNQFALNNMIIQGKAVLRKRLQMDFLSPQQLAATSSHAQREFEIQRKQEEDSKFEEILQDLPVKLKSWAVNGEFGGTLLSISEEKYWFHNAPSKYQRNWVVMQRLYQYLKERNFTVKITRRRTEYDFWSFTWKLKISWKPK